MSPYLAVFLSCAKCAYSFTVILILLINILNSFLKLAVKLTIWNCLPNTSLHSNIYYIFQVPPSVLSLWSSQFLYIGVILHPNIVSYGLSLAFYCFFLYLCFDYNELNGWIIAVSPERIKTSKCIRDGNVSLPCSQV